MAVIAIVLLFAMVLCGVPVALALIGSALFSLLVFAPDLLLGAPLSIVGTASNYVLLAIPLFIMAGEVAIRGRLIEPLVELTRAVLAPIPGGAGAATVLTCMFFAGITGSTAAEAAAVGTFGLPVLKRAGYPLPFATGIIATASTFGILIPPSLTMVLFGSITLTPVASLFMAGLLPGLLLGCVLMIIVGLMGWAQDIGDRQAFAWRPIATAAVGSLWVLAIPVVVVVGIYSGMFTPTEVAAVVVAYGLCVSAFVYRTITFADLIPICRATMRITAMLYLILIGASLFAFVMTAEGVPQSVVSLVSEAHLSQLQFLFILNALLLLMGCIFDGLSMLVIALPLIYPVATTLGIDPLHLAVLMTINIEIGVLMPPVGINLYVLSGISGLKVQRIVVALWPFYVFLLVGLTTMTYFPIFSTLIPRLMF